MTKNYSEMDIVIALDNFHEIDEERRLLEGVAIPHQNLDAFLKDVVALAEKHGGASFEELLDNDFEDESITAALNRNFRENADELIRQAERLLD